MIAEKLPQDPLDRTTPQKEFAVITIPRSSFLPSSISFAQNDIFNLLATAHPMDNDADVDFYLVIGRTASMALYSR